LLRADHYLEAGDSGAHLQGTTFGDSLARDVRNLQCSIVGLTLDDLNRAVDRLVAARRVYVIAGFSAFALAHYFGLGLSRFRPNVQTLASNDSVSNVWLGEIADSDCLLAFTFPRYAQFTQRAGLWAQQRKATIVAVTDTAISPIGRMAETVLVASPSGTGQQNSMVAPMAVANALLSGVMAARGDAALDHYKAIDRLFDEQNSFELKSN
jgi:DNA-binding MurR/RpiR family transcriptional regulator